MHRLSISFILQGDILNIHICRSGAVSLQMDTSSDESPRVLAEHSQHRTQSRENVDSDNTTVGSNERRKPFSVV